MKAEAPRTASQVPSAQNTSTVGPPSPAASNAAPAPSIFDRQTGKSFQPCTVAGPSTVPNPQALNLLRKTFSSGPAPVLTNTDLLSLEAVATLVRVFRIPASIAFSADWHPSQLPPNLLYTEQHYPNHSIMVIRWRLAHQSAKGGYIIQHIVADDWVTGEHENYWEAWKVKPGRRFTTISWTIRPRAMDDIFSSDPGTTFTSTARFYEALELPRTFFPRNPATWARDLPSTTVNPNFPTQDASPAVTRHFKVP